MADTQENQYLVGARFGKLTVLRQAGSVDGRQTWLCRCECGKEVVFTTYDLENRHTRSCGCAAKTGSGFDKLTFEDGTCLEMLEAAKRVRKNNTSGVPGVDWRASKQLWRAAICFKGKRYYLGSYAKFEDAVAARKRGEAELHDPFIEEHLRKAAEAGKARLDDAGTKST